MASVVFEDIGAGRFRVDGRLSFDTVAQALEASRRLFAEYQRIELDLSGVEATDSAGLALLIEWTGRARRSRCALTFRNIPGQVMAIARISDVDKLLPIVQ
ncbi:MAG: STAS domain-containing protein [Gammaproteobacteria bacterium]|nr:STAS domain-containing protein [Gammaproteobacteria bacterium]